MALAAGALIEVEDLLQELQAPAASLSARTAELERVIMLASSAIENALHRPGLIWTGADTPLEETHSPRIPSPQLWLRRYPIIDVASVRESAERDWTSDPLTVGRDYVVNTARGRLERLTSGVTAEFVLADAACWPSGVSSFAAVNPRWPVGASVVQVRYRGGYTTRATLPFDIVDVCRRFAALRWREITRGEQGVTGSADAAGNFTRYATARLTREMLEQLRPYMATDLQKTADA